MSEEATKKKNGSAHTVYYLFSIHYAIHVKFKRLNSTELQTCMETKGGEKLKDLIAINNKRIYEEFHSNYISNGGTCLPHKCYNISARICIA